MHWVWKVLQKWNNLCGYCACEYMHTLVGDKVMSKNLKVRVYHSQFCFSLC